MSINIIPDVDAPSELDTHNVMQWGQFVDHDITHTPLFRLSNENSTGIQCCNQDGSATINRLIKHPECFPIEIPSNDPFFSKHGQRCMNFVRSMPGIELTESEITEFNFTRTSTELHIRVRRADEPDQSFP